MNYLKLIPKILTIIFIVFIFSIGIGTSYSEEYSSDSSTHTNNGDIGFDSNYNIDSDLINNSLNHLNFDSYSNSYYSNSFNDFNTTNYSNTSKYSVSSSGNDNNTTVSHNSNIIISNEINILTLGDEIYVSTNGNDSNDGYTPETGKKTISAALTAVNNGGTIYILGGTYTGTGNVGLSINKNVTIIGNKTLQDVIIDGQNNNQRIMTVVNNVNLVIQNIRFTNARFVGNGAVIYGSGTLSVNITLNNCSFINNYASAEGGAIYIFSGSTASRTNLTMISCTFTNNTANSGYGGAIGLYYGTLLYIENSTFNNNTATYSGAIETNQINTTMVNSNFTGNRATLAHGGVMNHDNGANTINVINSIFTNNTCYIDGGVFRVSSLAKLNINNSVFTGNFAGNDGTAEGGAIYSEGGVVTVRDSNFTNNGAYLRGGAIGSYSSLSSAGLFVYGCNFVNNYIVQTTNAESSNTILIWGNQPVEINYNRFYNNTGSPNNYVIFVHDALSNASLSYNWWGDNKLPIANTLALNKITNYFVVDVVFDSISSDIANFNYTIRLNDSESFEANRLPNFYGNITTDPNFFNGNFTADVSGTINIPLNGNSGNITFNFKVDDWHKSIVVFAKYNTTLVLDSIPDTSYGNNVPITGKLIDENGNPISGASINLTINGFSYTVITEIDGTFSLNYTVNSTGIIDVIGEFYGTDDFLPASNITSFNVIQTNTSLTIDPIPDTKIEQTVVINGTLFDSEGNPLGNLTVNVWVNGFLYSVTTDGNGKFNVTYLVNTTGLISVFAQFSGTEKYRVSSNTTSFNGLFINTTIIIDNIPNTQIGNTTIITGTLINEYNQPISNVNLTININGFDYIVQTNSTGGFYLSYIVNLTGIITVFVYYNGNETYFPSSNSTTFFVSRINSNIIVDPINNTKIGDSINITGTLVDEYGQIIANETIIIHVNGFIYNVTTDLNGRFILTYLVNTTGTITVLFQYDGNDRYGSSTNTTYFNSSKINTNIIVDSINDTKIGNKVNITGTLVDEDNNPITNDNISITINGIMVIVLTNSTGGFSYEYTVINTGTINVRYDYEGNNVYNPTINTTTFNGLKLDTIIILNIINDTRIGNNVSISGILVDENGNLISGGNITIIIGDNSYEISTGSDGKFSLNYTVSSSGNIYVIYQYLGDDIHTSSSNTTSFIGLKIKTSIIVDDIINTSVGSSVNITGMLIDEDGVGIANANIIININGITYNVITDPFGRFTLNYTFSGTGSIGINYIYEGSDIYEASSNFTSFNGIRLNTSIVIDDINNTRIGNNVSVSGTLVDENGNPIANANITIMIDGVSISVATDGFGKFILNYTVNRSGIISVIFEYGGNETYNPSTNTAVFEVLKINSNIIVDSINDTKIGNKVNITGILVDEDNNPITDVNISITINGIKVIVVTNSTGGFSYEYTVNTSSYIDVVLEYGGNDNYNPSSNSTTFQGLKIDTTIVIDDINNTRIGNNVSVSGTLVDENGNPIANANITIMIDGVSISVATDGFGKLILNYTVNRSGIISVIFEYRGNDTHNPSSNSTFFEGLKLDTQIIVYDVNDTKMGDNVNITGILVDEDGEGIANANVTINVNDVIYTVITDTNGKFNLNYSVISTGSVKIVFEYGGNETYNPSTNFTSFIALKLDSNIIVNNINDVKIGNIVNITGTLVDENGNMISNASIIITINGINVTVVTNSTGGFSYEYTVTTSGNINVKIVYEGNEIYNSITNTTTFNGLKINTTIEIDSINNTKYNNTVVISGRLFDEFGNPIINAIVNLYIDGYVSSVLTDENGIFIFNYILNRTGDINIVLIYEGNNTFESATNGSFFIGLRLNTTLIFDYTDNTMINDTAIISGVLVDEYNLPIANTQVNVFVDGFLYVVFTDENGRFSLNYQVTSSGIKNVLGTFPGTDIFAPSTNTTSFNGLSLNTNIIFDLIENVTINDTITINGTLLDENNNPVSNVNITITINGTDFTVSTDSNGRFSVSYFVGNETGLFIVNGVFNGNMEYEYSYNSTSFTVNKIPTDLTVPNVAGDVGSGVNITSTLTDENGSGIVGKNIIFYIKINGSYVVIGTTTTDANGIATIQYTPDKSGRYDILGVFLEDNIYLGSIATGLATFSFVEINLIVSNITGSVGNTVNLTATLTDNKGNPIANKIIDFYVDGNYIGSNFTDANGVAKYSYLITNAGNHTIKGIFKGDNYTVQSNGTGIGSFTPGETHLEIGEIDGKVGDTIDLVAKLTDKNGKPLTNKNIDFYINGKYIGSAMTNIKGIAKLSYLITQKRFTLTVTFKGDFDYLGSENSRKSNVSSNETSNPVPLPTPKLLPRGNAGMKETGIPLLAILLVLLSTLGISIRKKFKE